MSEGRSTTKLTIFISTCTFMYIRFDLLLVNTCMQVEFKSSWEVYSQCTVYISVIFFRILLSRGCLVSVVYWLIMVINYQIWRFYLQTKGELHPERKEAFEKAQKAYEKLLANTSSLAVSGVNCNKTQLLFSDVV